MDIYGWLKEQNKIIKDKIEDCKQNEENLENSIKEKYNYGLTKSQAHKLNDSIQEDINKLTGKF